MCSGTQDFYRLCSPFSYVAAAVRMTCLIHVLCASSHLLVLHGGGGGLVLQTGHSPLTLTHLMHEYQPNICLVRVLLCGFGDVT